MPKETDRKRLELLLRLLRDPASNVVLFKRRAFEGTSEPDDIGLARLLPGTPRDGQKAAFREALADFLDGGTQPSRIEYAYEDGDPEMIYEFRIEFCRTRVYVKTELKDPDSEDPTLVIKSVKRWN
jgi:hypothetical protein